jgi:hypothetical protein
VCVCRYNIIFGAQEHFRSECAASNSARSGRNGGLPPPRLPSPKARHIHPRVRR